MGACLLLLAGNPREVTRVAEAPVFCFVNWMVWASWRWEAMPSLASGAGSPQVIAAVMLVTTAYPVPSV